MKESDWNELWAESLRRPLSPKERERLRAAPSNDPSGDAAGAEDFRLAEIVRGLPDFPVSSNFTARVMQAVQEESSQRREPFRGAWAKFLGRRRVPAFGLAVLVFVLGAVSYLDFREAARFDRARSVSTVSGMATLPSVEALQDFEAISRLSHAPKDAEIEFLLTALE